MSNRILLLTILSFLICVGSGFASNMNYYYEPNGLATATGTVEATARNYIKIYDEERKRLEGFVYLGQEEQFHKGDYVRIYYHPRGAIVAMIKRMTVLEYKMNGRNLGYISR